MEGISNQQTWIVILETHYFVFKRTYPLHKCNHQFAIKPCGQETHYTIVVMLIFFLFFYFFYIFCWHERRVPHSTCKSLQHCNWYDMSIRMKCVSSHGAHKCNVTLYLVATQWCKTSYEGWWRTMHATLNYNFNVVLVNQVCIYIYIGNSTRRVMVHVNLAFRQRSTKTRPLSIEWRSSSSKSKGNWENFCKCWRVRLHMATPWLLAHPAICPTLIVE